MIQPFSLEDQMREVVIAANVTGVKQERCWWNEPLRCLVTLTAEPAPNHLPARRQKRRVRRKR